MKLLTSLLALFGILFLISCSDFNQDFSPVSPNGSNYDKMTTPIDVNYPYAYLQEFSQVGVKSFSAAEVGGITVELEAIKSSRELNHVFAVLNYSVNQDPSESYVVYLGLEQKADFIQIPDYNINGLEDVRIYRLADANDVVINGQFALLKQFTSLTIEYYVVSDGMAKIRLQNWDQSMTDTFAEIHYKTGSTLVYLQALNDRNFDMPIKNEADFTGLDIYSAF